MELMEEVEKMLQEMEKDNSKYDNDFIVNVSACAWPAKEKSWICGAFPYMGEDYATSAYGSTIAEAVENYYKSGDWTK